MDTTSMQDGLKQYWVELSDPQDRAGSGPSSFGTGRHGHAVRAVSIEDAAREVVARARREGYYGKQWSAKITLLDRHGRKVWEPLGPGDLVIDLWD